MNLNVSPKVKKESSRRRIANTLKLYGNACRYYNKDIIEVQEFAEYIGLDPKYWQLIIHGHRGLSDSKIHDIEKRLGLPHGELDKPVNESILMPNLMWECMEAVQNKVNSIDSTINSNKGLEMTMLLYESSILKGEVDTNKLESLVKLAS